jgi:tetratricopeptide (TPR) repeat protein
MRLRSFFGFLLALAVVVLASYLTHHNRELFGQRFAVGQRGSISVASAFVLVFLAGFLPAAITLVVDTLRLDLDRRRRRRATREAESLDASFRRAVDAQADGQWVKAAAELESFLAGRPQDFPALLRYGTVLRELGRDAEAVEVHKRAAAVDPHSVAVLYQLAEDYASRGEHEVARELHGRIVRDFPGFGLEVLRRRRQEALARLDWSEAARLHEKATALLNESGDAASLARESSLAEGLAYQRGVLSLEQDRPAEAREIFDSLLAREPRFIPARIMQGEAELLGGRQGEAVAAWRQGYLETGSPVFLQRIEDHFIEEEQPVEAIETLRQLIVSASNDLLPRFYLGRLYHRLEMHEEALKQLAAIEDRIRSSPTFHYLVARIHERRGDLARAVESYVACLRQLEIGNAEYVCRICHTRYADWRDYCAKCGSWNAVELNFEEDRLEAADLGVREVPVWGVGEDSGEFSLATPSEEK